MEVHSWSFLFELIKISALNVLIPALQIQKGTGKTISYQLISFKSKTLLILVSILLV